MIFAVPAHACVVQIPAVNAAVVIVLLAADRTRSMALGGILLALSVGLLYIKTILPFLDFSIYIFLSFFTGIMLQETSQKWAWVFFASAVLLSLLLPVNKLALLIYYSFFGYYGIIKFYIEKIKNRIPVYLLKIMFINIILVINYFLASEFLPQILNEDNQLYLFMAVATVFVFIYDYIYTLAMVFYNSKISRLMKRS